MASRPCPPAGTVPATSWEQLKPDGIFFYWSGARSGWEPSAVVSMGEDGISAYLGGYQKVTEVKDLSRIRIKVK